jgi:hypothetical protein
MAHIRKVLGKAGHPLRGGLCDLISNAPTDSLGDTTVLVPDEIRAFLDALVVP